MSARVRRGAGALAEGTLVAGRYRIVERLGGGGMGEVFAAVDTQLERKVALKTLGRALLDSAEFRARFEREAKAAARTSHPSIAQVYERGEHDGAPFIVSELLPGHNLRARIEAAGRLAPGFAARIGGDVADAIHSAHLAGIVHRDLKPDNVFLADMGQPRETIKVLDFGLAKLLDAAQLTASAEVLGTPAYMAPEQLLSSRDVGPAADIWSVGCIVYELVSGRPPFTAGSHPELVAAILNDEPEPLRRYAHGAPPELEAVLARALSKQPAARQGSAAELARALYEVAAELGESVPTRSPSGRPAASAATRVAATRVAAIDTGAGTQRSSVSTVVPRGSTATPAAGSPAGDDSEAITIPRSSQRWLWLAVACGLGLLAAGWAAWG